MKPSVPSPERSPEPPSLAERLLERAMFEAAHDYAYHSLRRLGIPACDRPDLIQEVIVAAYVRRAEYRAERGAPATWLGGFLINAVRNYWRKRSRHQRLLRVDSAEEQAVVPSSDEASSVSEEHRRILLDELLPKVPFDQRVIVVARDLDELEMRVIAEREEIALSTAYDRYQRGRAALERAHAGWRSQQSDRGLLFVPVGLEELLHADRSIPKVPAEMGEAALQRFHRARPWKALRASLQQPVSRSALTHAACALVGAALHAALSSRDPAPPPILPLPPIVAVASAVATSAAATLETAAGPPPSATVAVPASRPVSPPPPRAPMLGSNRVARVPVVAEVDAGRAAEDALDEEQAFDAARRAFDRGDLGVALSGLRLHERDFPGGALAAERELLWVKALVKSGRVDEARARLDHLHGTALAKRLSPLVPPNAGSAAQER